MAYRIPRLRIPVERLTAVQADRPYELAVHDFPEELTVHGFRGRESLSDLFRFDIDVTTPSEEELEETALGRPAAFVMRFGRLTRTVRGIVGAMRLTAAHPEPRRLQYRLRLVPRMWLLRHRKRSQIFQDASIPDVVDRVLGEVGIEARWVLEQEHPKRAYLTQYEETDWTFVRRLLAEAGMYFADEPIMALAAPADRERIWISDGASGYAALESVEGVGDGTLPFLGASDSLAVGRGGIFDVRFGRALRTQRAAYREYDPDRPGALLEEQGGETGRRAHPLESYEHHGAFLFPHWPFAKNEPDRILRRKRRRAATVEGEANSLGLLVAHRFHLLDHPVARVNADYVVTAVRHVGHAWTDEDHLRTYESRFACVPANVVVPAGPTPPRRPLVTLTAKVVGPGQDDIHVDEQGRIKVRFHWDRRPRTEGNDTCWLRSMQAWAGGSFGTQFIPRVGMEVVVSFEGGDPDKPLVLGSVHNGHAPPTFTTPSDKTRSGLRTRSSPGGDGYNELSFEDRSGEEQFFIRAQRDLDEKIGRNRTVRIEEEDVLRVGGNKSDHIAGSFTRRVEHALNEHIGEATLTYRGPRREICEAGSEVEVLGPSTRRVGGSYREEIAGASTVTLHGDSTRHIRGNETILIGTADAKRSCSVHTEGTLQLAGTEGLSVSSPRSVSMASGGSTFRVTEDRIELEANSVIIRGGGGVLSLEQGVVRVETAGAILQLDGDRLTVKTKGASASFGSEVHIDGEKVLINSPDRLTEDPVPEPAPRTTIELTDRHGRPIPNQRYVIRLQDGSELSGRLDDEGKATVEVPSDAMVTFPELSGLRAG